MNEHQAVLHIAQVWLFVGQRELVVHPLPIALTLALFVIVKKARVRLAAQTTQIFHPEDQIIRLAGRIGIAHGRLGRACNLGPQIDRGLIGQLHRPHREAQQLCRVIYQLRCCPFGDHPGAFVGIGDDAAVGIEEPRIVDHDGRFADLAHIIERFGNRTVACFGALDDLDQRHFFDRREEVDADELIRTAGRFGQLGDRQGRGVGGKDAIFGDHGFDALGHLGLDGRVFEYGFDDQVAAFQRIQIGGRSDQVQRGGFLFFGGFLARDALVKEARGIGFALVGGFLGLVDQHDLDPGLYGHKRDTRTHHAGTQHA